MPYIYASVVFTCIGSGLLTTLSPSTSTGKWVGYQILYGFGCGCGFQLPQIAAQTVLPFQDIQTGIAITLFFQNFGGALFVSVGNNVLNDKLVEYIADLNIPSVDPQKVVQLGATAIRGYVGSAFLPEVISAYNEALIKVLQVAVIISCLGLLGAMGMEWKSVKVPKQPVDEEQTENPQKS